MNFALFPLPPAIDDDLQNLCKTLWGWPDCSHCNIAQPCMVRDTCPWRRFHRLKRFFDFYRSLTRVYVPDFLEGSPALRSHEDVCHVACVLRDNPQSTISQLIQMSFAQRDAANLPPKTDQTRALNLATRVLFMVDIPLGSSHLPHTVPLLGKWPDSSSVLGYLMSTFKAQSKIEMSTMNVPMCALEGGETWDKILSVLSARTLKRIASLQIVPTDDLAEHLGLDRAKGIVKVFHHLAFLKEHLHSSRTTASNQESTESSMSPFPRRLALEIIRSVQNLLFPPDPKSQAIIRTMVEEKSFDPECLQYNASDYELDSEKDIQYQWLGPRLMDLYGELCDPTPRGSLEKWIERRSRDRHVMMATAIGILVAILLGLMSLVVSILQTWIAWQQWKGTPAS